MRKLFFTAAALVMPLMSFAWGGMVGESGFTHMVDGSVGYGLKDKKAVIQVGYNLGYTFPMGLYAGVGPVLNEGVYSGGSEFSVGAYGKVHYTLPMQTGDIKPFVEANGGCIKDVQHSHTKWIAIFGAGIGVNFKQHFNLSFLADFDQYNYIESKTTHTSYKIHSGTYKDSSGTLHRGVAEYGSTTSTDYVNKKGIEFIPTLAFSYCF